MLCCSTAVRWFALCWALCSVWWTCPVCRSRQENAFHFLRTSTGSRALLVSGPGGVSAFTEKKQIRMLNLEQLTVNLDNHATCLNKQLTFLTKHFFLQISNNQGKPFFKLITDTTHYSRLKKPTVTPIAAQGRLPRIPW